MTNTMLIIIKAHDLFMNLLRKNECRLFHSKTCNMVVVPSIYLRSALSGTHSIPLKPHVAALQILNNERKCNKKHFTWVCWQFCG